MTSAQAKKNGSRQALISVGIGVVIAQLLITMVFANSEGLIKGFFWFHQVDYGLNIFIGVCGMFACGHFFGQRAGKLILMNRWNPFLTGMLAGPCILVSASFLGGWTGFFQEGIHRTAPYSAPLFDYIVKPMYWVTLFGVFPAMVVGIWFGWSIKQKGKKR